MIPKIFLSLLIALWVCGYSHAQNDPQELITTAQRAFDDGFHDVAIKYLEEFIPAYPQDPKINQAKLLLGQCYFFKNDYSKAVALFEQLNTSNENRDQILFWTAETQLKLGDYSKAQVNYQELLKEFSSSVYVPQALYSWGWSLFDQKEYLKAKDIFIRLTTQFPKHQLSEDAVEKSGECDFNLGDFASAVKTFEAFAQSYPQSARLGQVRLNAADAYYYMEDYPRAMDYYEQAAKMLLQDPASCHAANVGKIWSAIKRKMYDQAQKFSKEALDMARSRNLSTENILLALGQMYFEKGDMDAAINAYNDLIKNFPGGSYKLEAYLGRGNALFESKKLNEAKEDFQFIIDHLPRNEESLGEKANFGLGWVLIKLGDVAAGVRCFGNVFEHSTHEATRNNALIQMADAYQESGRFNEAVGIYEQVIRESRTNGVDDYIQYRLGVAFLKAEKFDSAQAAFDVLKNKFPNSKYLEDLNYYFGVIQFKNNNWPKAAQFMDTFLKGLTHPSDFAPEANYILALSYLNQKQCDEALKIFQKILRLYPDDEAVAKNSDIGIAKCQFEAGQVKEAIKRFKLIVFKYPKTEVEQEALLWLAQDAMKNFQYAQAVDYYRALLEKGLDQTRQDQVNYELGQAFEVQGALDEALAQYKLVSEVDSALASKVKLAIAGILSKEFDPQKAINAYTSIAQTSPDYARDAYLKMAQLYRDAQNYEQEISVYEKALKCEQGKSMATNVELLFSLADAYEALSRIDEAVDFYLKIPVQFPDQTTWVVKAYLRVAKIFEDRKDWEGAKVTYQKIVQLKVDESRYALERLDMLKKK